MIHLIDNTYYEVVPKERLSPKGGYELPTPPEGMRVKTIISIGTKCYDQMNGYKKLLKNIPVNYATHTLIIVVFDIKRPCELIENLFR